MTSRLALIPRDGLFCKDGRGWHTSSSGRAHALGWPFPSTVLGALRTAWGRARERALGRTFIKEEWTAALDLRLGKTLALRRLVNASWAPEHRLWPVTADAVYVTGQESGQPLVVRLEPSPPQAGVGTLGRDDDPARESLWRPELKTRAKPCSAPRWWTEADFMSWLTGGEVTSGEGVDLSSRQQVHVSIDPKTSTARDGFLYTTEIIETLVRTDAGIAEWAIAVSCSLPAAAGDGEEIDLTRESLTLGGKSRLCGVEPLPAEVFDPPEALLAAFRKRPLGLRLVVVSPAHFARGWLPDDLQSAQGEGYRGPLPGLGDEVVLRSACVARPAHVSGWDMAAGQPKPTRRLVPSGSVYYFVKTSGEPFGEADARALWLAPWGDDKAGWIGHAVPGVWSPPA